jgi:hypothetical protein
MEDVGTFYVHWVYFTAIGFIILWIFWSFGIFFPFWCVVPRKIWQPWRQAVGVGT